MAFKTTLYTASLLAIMTMAAPHAHAVTDDGGFGAPFANTGHSGFDNPVGYTDSNTNMADMDTLMDTLGQDLQNIAPAAGIETNTDQGMLPVTETESIFDAYQDMEMREGAPAETLGP